MTDEAEIVLARSRRIYISNLVRSSLTAWLCLRLIPIDWPSFAQFPSDSSITALSVKLIWIASWYDLQQLILTLVCEPGHLQLFSYDLSSISRMVRPELDQLLKPLIWSSSPTLFIRLQGVRRLCHLFEYPSSNYLIPFSSSSPEGMWSSRSIVWLLVIWSSHPIQQALVREHYELLQSSNPIILSSFSRLWSCLRPLPISNHLTPSSPASSTWTWLTTWNL